MVDQSVRACHPSKFYYFRRSLLISCCYILSPSVPHSPLPSSRIPVTLPSPFTPFSLSFSLSLVWLAPSSSTSFHLLVIPLLFGRFHLWLPARHEKKKEREKEKEKERKRALACYIGERNKTATESRARLFWFRGCCLFSAVLLYSKFICSAFHFHSFEASHLRLVIMFRNVIVA